MRLGIDMDGVMCDFNAGWMRLHAAEFGSELRPEMVVGWNGLHELAGFADMTEFWAWAQGRDERASIFRHLEPFPGALATMRALADAGHDIVVLTAKPDWAIPDTLSWLGEHAVPTREIHVRDDKHVVDCDVYVDDSPAVLADLQRHRADRLVCRMVQPWNRPVDGTVDVGSWDDVWSVVTERSRQPSAGLA